MRLSSVVIDEEVASEQKAQALAINEAIKDDVQEHVGHQWKHLKLSIGAGVVTAVVGIGLIVSGRAMMGVVLLILGVAGGAGGRAYVLSREPDMTVTSIEKGYWTGHLVPSQDGTVVFDATETIEPQQFQLNLLENPDRAREIEQYLDEVREFPVVMTDDHDIEQQFVDTLSEVEAEIEGCETQTVEAPVLSDGDPAVETLSQLRSVATATPVEAGGVSLSREQAIDQVETFSEFESIANEDHGESSLLNVSEQSREIATELSGLQQTATELLNDHIQTAGDMFGLVSYNFYCPDCWDDDIESQLDLIDRDGEWYCETCRSNFPPNQGIARHRIRDEVVLDVWEQLWIEKDDERRQIYESIEDQKAELEEREFEQQREEIRSVEGRIKEIRSKIRDLQTEANAKQGIVERTGHLMTKYDRMQEARVEKFRQDVTDAFSEIDDETRRALEETDGIIQDRIEEAESTAAKRAELMREEDRQRHKEKLAHEERMTRGEMAHDQAVAKAEASAISQTIAETHANKPAPRGK